MDMDIEPTSLTSRKLTHKSRQMSKPLTMSNKKIPEKIKSLTLADDKKKITMKKKNSNDVSVSDVSVSDVSMRKVEIKEEFFRIPEDLYPINNFDTKKTYDDQMLDTVKFIQEFFQWNGKEFSLSFKKDDILGKGFTGQVIRLQSNPSGHFKGKIFAIKKLSLHHLGRVGKDTGLGYSFSKCEMALLWKIRHPCISHLEILPFLNNGDPFVIDAKGWEPNSSKEEIPASMLDLSWKSSNSGLQLKPVPGARLFLVMSYVPFKLTDLRWSPRVSSLKKIIKVGLKKKRCPGNCGSHLDKSDIKQFMSIFFQLLSMIFYLHQRRIVHRDIKPDNLLLRNSTDAPVTRQDKISSPPAVLVLADMGISLKLPNTSKIKKQRRNIRSSFDVRDVGSSGISRSIRSSRSSLRRSGKSVGSYSQNRKNIDHQTCEQVVKHMAIDQENPFSQGTKNYLSPWQLDNTFYTFLHQSSNDFTMLGDNDYWMATLTMIKILLDIRPFDNEDDTMRCWNYLNKIIQDSKLDLTNSSLSVSKKQELLQKLKKECSVEGDRIGVQFQYIGFSQHFSDSLFDYVLSNKVFLDEDQFETLEDRSEYLFRKFLGFMQEYLPGKKEVEDWISYLKNDMRSPITIEEWGSKIEKMMRFSGQYSKKYFREGQLLDNVIKRVQKKKNLY